MMFYNPANWYWLVGGDASRVYSSARAAYVPATDRPTRPGLRRAGRRPGSPTRPAYGKSSPRSSPRDGRPRHDRSSAPTNSNSPTLLTARRADWIPP